MTQPPNYPMPPQQRPPKPKTRAAWLIGAGVVAVFAVLVVIGTVMKDETTDAETATTSAAEWPTMPDPTVAKTSAPAPVPTTVPTVQRTATATLSADYPSGLNARCSQAPADDVTKIQAKFKDSTQRLAHAVILTGADGRKYLGASVVKADGVLVQKSDVWVHTISSGWTAATGGARSTTTWPKTSDVVTNVDLGGEDVQTADRCAYDWAKISGYN
ncbi:hypothetical protein ACTWPB_07700 [Nocardia sp. IBHARD005]|uniref:hypothetical protein n=1 Tax=Nocardia sp. IBHARD005 TaxID=3457765 RepID=UPI004058D1B1